MFSEKNLSQKKKFKYCLDYSTAGQITLEVLISLFVMVISVSTAIIVSFGGQSMTLDTQISNSALTLGRQDLEISRALGKQNFDSLVNSSSTNDIYLKEIIVENVDAHTKKITSRISWSTEKNKRNKIELTTLITNYKTIIESGGDTTSCGAITGNWSSPRTLGSINLGTGNSATDLDVINKIVYITSVASDASKPDLFIVNANSSSSPFIVLSVNTGPGANAIDVTGNYAYMANNGTNNQLEILDTVNISSSTKLDAQLTLSGVSGSGAIGNSIFYFNSKIYIGTKKATGPEFHIIDVSNPFSPVELGSKEINADVNAIAVSGNYAYLATSDSSKNLQILNISNPSNITLVGSLQPPGGEPALSLYLTSNALYLGRQVGAGAAKREFHIIDVSSTTSPQDLGAVDIAATVNGLRAGANLAFLATADSNKEFQVWNISDPLNITFLSSLDFPASATGIDCENNIMYVSLQSNDGLRIITPSP